MIKRYRKLWGMVFIILGLIILLTPFTPGSVLLLIGLDMLFGDKWLWWNQTKKRILVFLKRFKVFKNIES